MITTHADLALWTAMQRGELPDLTIERPDWFDAAACRGTDPAVFFPKGQPSRKIAELCGPCSVRRQCVFYAIDNGIHSGWYGGLSPEARVGLDRDAPLTPLRGIVCAEEHCHDDATKAGYCSPCYLRRHRWSKANGRPIDEAPPATEKAIASRIASRTQCVRETAPEVGAVSSLV